MASTRRKAAAIAIAVVGIAGLSLASAATLNINSGSLGAGTTVVASCQSAAITVGYTSAWDVTAKAYKTTGVTLTGVESTCNAKAVRVTLTGATGTSLAEFTGTAATGVTTINLPAGSVDPTLVLGTAVVISG